MPRDLIGETLLNQFRIENFIAAGGMATIYRVWDLQRSVPLAMKVLHPDMAADPSFMARFEREARSLQMLIHPHIVPFYGLYRADGMTFLLERYIDGPNLDEVLRWHAGRNLPLVEALVYFKALFTSLGYAHAQGIIHCDVKPGNVLIDQGGHVYLTDFGIARFMDAAVTTSSGLGTPLYMAPEQIRGERLTPRTDIYALGVVLFELLTGARPFRGDVDVPPEVGENPSDRIRYQQLYVQPPDPRSLNPQVPDGLVQVLQTAMAKDPEQRYHTVQAMANEIAGVVAARFETLPNRVRLPEELFRQDAGWRPEPPPVENGESAEFAYAAEAPGVGEWAPGYEPAGSVSAEPGDTLPGLPPAPRPLPESPVTAAAGAALHPRARLSPRLVALLAGLAVLAICTLASAGLLRAFRPAGAPNLPLPTQTQTGAASPAANTPTITPSRASETPPASGLSDFPISGEIVIAQRAAGVDKLFLVNPSSGQTDALPTVPNVNTSSSNAPQWSPDGQRLTWISQYNSRSHVVVMDMTEREPYQLPAGETYQRVSAPAFLPDGGQVSFWASGGGGNYLITADATSGEETGKTALNAYRNMFVWNRQNNQLAFIQQSESSYKVAVSSAPDGAGRLVDTGGEGYAPAWSNDGQWLAFQSDLNRAPGINEIWIARADGSDLHAVTSTPAEFWSRAPSWSPDGKMIAFVSNRSGSRGNDYGELFVVEVATGKTRQLTNTGGMVYDWRPAWKP